MRKMTADTPMEQATFLIRQQNVYLEKALVRLSAEGKPFHLAYLHSAAWDVLCDARTYDPAVMLKIDDVRFSFARAFAQTGGTLEVRFFDLNVLTLLFYNCIESEAKEFCKGLESVGQTVFLRDISIKWVGIDVFDVVFQNFNRESYEQRFSLSVGLSYQQNYLAQVVSCDRGEPAEYILLEAVDQVLLNHHRVVYER